MRKRLIAESSVPEFPVEALPESLAKIIAAEALATQTPPDLPAMLALSVIAAAVAKKWVVRIGESWEEPLNIYTATIMESGNRKSSVFRELTEVVYRHEAQQQEQAKPKIREAAQRKRLLQKKMEAEEKNVAKDKPPEGIVKNLAHLQSEIDEVDIPAIPRLIVDDGTPEKITSLLNQHGGRIAILSSEGICFDIILGVYSRGADANINVYLKGHAGDHIRVDRINRESELIMNPAISIGVTVQPEVIYRILANRRMRGVGLLARFLYSWPQSLIGKRIVDAPAVPPELKAEYAERINRLLSIPLPECPDCLFFEMKAKMLFNDFAKEIEGRQISGMDLFYMKDWASKLLGETARIAGLLHLWERSQHRDFKNCEIDSGTVERSICLARYFIEHARLIFTEIDHDPELEAAQYVLDVIRNKKLQVFTGHELHRQVRGTLKSAADLQKAIIKLLELNILRTIEVPVESKPGRKPSPTYELVPDIGDN